MATLQRTPGSACAWVARCLLGCLVLSALATLANAEIIGYDSWQYHGFTRTPIAASAGASPVSLLSSILLSSWSSDNIVSESIASSTVSQSDGNALLSGVVYFDANFNGARDSDDWAIRDAIVSLTAASSDTVLVATTDKYGNYTFSNLAVDDYTITLLAPTTAPGTTSVGFLEDASGARALSGEGVVVGQSIANVQLKSGYSGYSYDFGQNSYPTNLTSKRILLNDDPGDHHPDNPPVPPIVVPEPGALALLAVAGLCVAGFARRRKG